MRRSGCDKLLDQHLGGHSDVHIIRMGRVSWRGVARLTRTQQQERTRAFVLAAAREEFTKHGYAEAKVDRIAERADLTRGAVYSNFPSKRALYLAVLVQQLEAPGETAGTAPTSVAAALGAFARVWLERLPLTGDPPADGRLRARSLSGVLDDDRARTALAEAGRFEALLLGLALESLSPRHKRRVRVAELALTLLHGAGHLAEAAPGFGDQFDVVRACEHLAGLDLADAWDPPHLSYVDPARPCDDAWDPPPGLGGDGVVAVLGAARLGAAEEAVRAARGATVVAVVTGDPDEIGRLVRLRIGDTTGCLRRVFGPPAANRLHVEFDAAEQVAQAVGLAQVDDETETAVRVHKGRIVARARGRGAAHAAAASR
jgi:AcrR family transcriptional regulator